MTAALATRVAEARALLDAEWRQWETAAQAPPTVEVYDKDWRFVAHADGALDGSAEWVKNDAGESDVTWLADHPVARWMADDVAEAEDREDVAGDEDGAGPVIDAREGTFSVANCALLGETPTGIPFVSVPCAWSWSWSRSVSEDSDSPGTSCTMTSCIECTVEERGSSCD